jgi:hypothetical protein
MPRYTVLAKSFINNRLHEAGDEVEFDGDAGENLELIENPSVQPTKPDKKGKKIDDDLV